MNALTRPFTVSAAWLNNDQTPLLMSIAAPYKALLTLLLSRIALTMTFISCYVYRCSTSGPTYATMLPLNA